MLDPAYAHELDAWSPGPLAELELPSKVVRLVEMPITGEIHELTVIVCTRAQWCEMPESMVPGWSVVALSSTILEATRVI